jgi:alpha-beta hydrolase superfamily lysophospholipase
VRRASWRLEISEAVPLPGRFEIAADVVVPADRQADEIVAVLCCLPGGFLSRRYFDLEIDGHRDYSFAEAMAREGFITLAFDHVGVGDSSKPEPIEGGYTLGVEAIAAANQRALELALERLARGDSSAGIPSLPDPITIGVGHSMGSMLTVEQQSIDRPHAALLLFSFSTHGTPAFLDDAMREYANDPERVRTEIGELARRSMGSPYPPRAANSEGDRRAAFGVGTAPESAERALQAAATNLLATGGLMSMVPGGYGPPAAKIDVPVYMLFGDHDLHDDRHTRSELPACPKVTTFMLEDCWHCHFVANTRESMWRSATSWIRETVGSQAPPPLDQPDRSTLDSNQNPEPA